MTKGKESGLEVRQTFACFRCGTGFSKRGGNYYKMHSDLYKGLGYLPYCQKCVNEMYGLYLNEIKDVKLAIWAMCRKLDIYYKESICDNTVRSSSPHLAFSSYLVRIDAFANSGKNFDDSRIDADELWPIDGKPFGLMKEPPVVEPVADEEEPEDEIEVSDKVLRFWGAGFKPEFYVELERRYKVWTAGLKDLEPAEIALYKQICILEETINRETARGGAVDKYISTLNTVLGSANLKPSQKRNDDADTELDEMPLGLWALKWENTRPIPEPDPEFEDVDGIARFITIWYHGHAAKMLGVKNVYSRLYDEEIERLRVDHPEYEEDDDETFLYNIFGRADATDGDDDTG